jgi:hypothetical protein
MTTQTPAPMLPPLPPRRKAGRRAKSRTQSSFLPLVGVAVLLAMVALLNLVINPPLEEIPFAGLFAFPCAIGFVAIITRRAAREETRFDLRSIMLAGFALRGVGLVLRYSQPVDALVYHSEGVRIADGIRNFDLYPDPGRSIPGTGWIRYFSGVVHVFAADDMITTFVVFTVLAFLGAYLCYRAFVRAVPEGNHRRYALLVFLWPSLVYWPSSLGKEAWMIFGIGVGSWGISRVVTGRAGIGIPVVGVGVLIMSLVRPHVALMIIVGFAIALFARPTEKKSGARIAARLFSVVLLVVGGSLVAARASELLKSEDDIVSALDTTAAQTEQGGASFTPSVVRTPLAYPAAFVTVWFRPFPTEARGGGGPQLASSLENMLLFGLLVASWKRLRHLPRAMLRIPYVTYAVTYSFVFVYAFSAIGNFGILARQRTQGTILFFVVLCLPEVAATTKDRLSDGRKERADRMRARLLLRRKPAARSQRNTPYRERVAATPREP